MLAVTDEEAAGVIAFEDANFEIDPRLSAEERQDHARMQVAIERILVDRGFGAYTAHFDAIGDDGRFSRLPLAAASSLMAKGYGYAAEGDVLTACLVSAGHVLIGDAHFTEMYAMDFPSDSILQSHMGEGNWKIARTDRPVRLIKRPLGIGRLADPPTFLFQYQPGRRRWPRWSRWRASGSGSSWPRARTWTASRCRPWRCPTGSSGRPPACARA
jgi:L-arabinose isomerase